MTTLIIALAALSLGLIAIYYLSRNVLLGWYCLLGASIYAQGLGFSRSMIGGLHIDPGDIVAILLFAAGLVRFLYSARRPSNARLIAIGYLLLFAFSYLRGISENGFATANNEARGLIGEAVGMMYFFTIPIDSQTIEKWVKSFLWYAGALVGLGIYRYAAFGASDRVLNAFQADHISLALFLGLGWLVHRQGSRYLKWFIPTLGMMIVLLQHRTVWTATVGCLVFAAFIDGKIVRRLLPSLVIAGCFSLIVVGLFFGTREEAAAQFDYSTTNDGTLLWRIDAWQQSIESDDQTVVSVLMGKSFGTPYLRYSSNSLSYENLPPHSEYVGQYLRVGILGSLLLTIYMARPFVLLAMRHRRSSLSLFPSASVWSLIVLNIMIYGIAYSYETVAFAFIGVANALLLAPEAQETSAEEGEAGEPQRMELGSPI
jgi:hypothetical protein